jgi:CheY-like chemotaxis protein
VNARILIVDDNPVNLKLASDVLACEGYEIDRAEDAESAQRLLAQRTPDLVLMDIALPGMDGLALTRLIKSDDALRHVPVIAMTAFAMKGDDRRAFDAGCDGYIVKPIDVRTFASTVASHLERRSLP